MNPLSSVDAAGGLVVYNVLETILSAQQIDPNNIPQHIAIILDGNGRWARRKGLPRLEGHRRGYKTLREILRIAYDFNIKILTVYAFSSENWRRPKDEVTGLMKLIQYAAQVELNAMHKENVKFLISGRIDQIPESVQKQLLYNVEMTKNNTGILFNIAVNYGGRNEIVDATKQVAQMVKENKITVNDIDEKLLSSLMYHPELPDPELLIRTASELRISNFLLWETAYTELFVTDTLWPDFSKDDLIEAISSYQSRTRKFGKVVEEAEKKQIVK